MKKSMALLFALALILPACKSQKCGKYYDKLTECGIPTLGISRDLFVNKCKDVENNDKRLECAELSSCSDFVSCFKQ